MANTESVEPLKAAVETLEAGVLVDLEGDKYADPENMGEYEFAYAQVEDVEVFTTTEGEEIVAVSFVHDGGEILINFPKGHEIPVGE